MTRLLTIFILALFLVHIDAKKKVKCASKNVKVYKNVCLQKGFNTTVEGCEGASTDTPMNDEQLERCQILNEKLVNCGYACKPVPLKPLELIRKCGHDNTVFYGADMFERMYNRVEDCILDCRKSETCKAISYESRGVCVFKTKRGGANGPRVERDTLSVNMDCDRKDTGKLRNCERDMVSFSGSDLTSVASESKEQCIRFCQDTEDCRALSFRKSSKMCYLKSQRGGSGGPTPNADYISLNMECRSAPADLSCAREGISFTSAALRNLAVADIAECVAHCRETELCKSVTFRQSDHQCFLKSRAGGTYPAVATGHTSLNMECNSTTPTPDLNCTRAGFVFTGSDMGNIIVSGMVECVERCRDTQDCKAVTFRHSDNRCYLKNKQGGSTGPVSTTGHDSMNLDCDNSPVRNMNCIREETDFPGADLMTMLVDEKEECVRHCRDTERCQALSFFRAGDRVRCHFKQRRGGGSVPVSKAGVQSMNMECDNRRVRELGCLRENVMFYGADIGNTVVEDERACLKLCRDTEGCMGFTFRTSDSRCYAKSQRGGADNGVRKEWGHNSMNLECDTRPISESLKCLRRGIAYSDSDLSSHLIVADETECIMYCRDTERCVAITFRESDHRCYLKYKRGGDDGASLAPGYNSANMECDNTRPPQLQCNFLEERFPGNEMHHVRVSGMEECLRMFRDAQDCQAISFREKDNVCEMKRARFEWWTIKSHYKSVNMDCVSG